MGFTTSREVLYAIHVTQIWSARRSASISNSTAHLCTPSNMAHQNVWYSRPVRITTCIAETE